jgi:hypothetical protein
MTLDFLFEIWIEKCFGGCMEKDSREQAKEYFEEGLEYWEFENECERQWLAMYNY